MKGFGGRGVKRGGWDENLMHTGPDDSEALLGALCVGRGGGKDKLERGPTCPVAVLRVESTPRV